MSRVARRIVGTILDFFRGKPDSWKQIPKIGEPVKNRPWVPPGWPYAGWFNFNPSHSTGLYPVFQPKPDVELKRKALEPKFDISKRHGEVVRSIDQLSLDQLRAYIFDTRGPIYAERRPQLNAAEIEQGFLERLSTGSFVWDKHEKQDILSRRKFRAENSGNEFDVDAELRNLDEPMSDTSETRQFLKEYAKDLEGYGWQDPYELTDNQVEEEAAVLRDLWINIPNRPWHAPQHEWTQRQDLLVDSWQSVGLPCFAGDAYRFERQPQPPWTKGVQYIGKHPRADEFWGPPGSARTEADDEMLPPGTDPKAPKPLPVGLRSK